MPKRFLLLIGLLCLPFAAGASPAGNSLERFFQDVHTYSARFHQVVLDESLNVIQESSGTLWIERPNKFRWNYVTPYKEEIVGDGKRIWVYDQDLQQVTVRAMTGGLGYTPAILLSGGGRLEDHFVVKQLGTAGKLEWAEMIPKKNDGGFKDIRIGFENGRIRVLQMLDNFGQTTRITLEDGRENQTISQATFKFTPPPGVDVVGME